jgi:hypothetical protein
VDDIITITLRVARVCEQLGLRYLVGGSLASSLHGIPRATQDVDLVVAIGPRDVRAFVDALRDEFYLDEGAIRTATEHQGSFNLVHLTSYFKADVFVAKDDEASRLQMNRGRKYLIGDEPARSLIVASPEDVIAQKLHWFALGERTSERQWNDAIGVMKVTRSHLDVPYLRRIADLLGVEGLLQEAAREAGLSLPLSG